MGRFVFVMCLILGSQRLVAKDAEVIFGEIRKTSDRAPEYMVEINGLHQGMSEEDLRWLAESFGIPKTMPVTNLKGKHFPTPMTDVGDAIEDRILHKKVLGYNPHMKPDEFYKRLAQEFANGQCPVPHQFAGAPIRRAAISAAIQGQGDGKPVTAKPGFLKLFEKALSDASGGQLKLQAVSPDSVRAQKFTIKEMQWGPEYAQFQIQNGERGPGAFRFAVSNDVFVCEVMPKARKTNGAAQEQRR